MTIVEAQLEMEYTVKSIETDDEGLVKFLFSLGCYEGEPITVISKKKKILIVAIKDARYSIDLELARSIVIE